SRTSKLTSSRTALGPKDFLMCLNSINRGRPSLPRLLHDLRVLHAVELRELRVEVRIALRLDPALVGPHAAGRALAVALVELVDDLHAAEHLAERGEPHGIEAGVVDQ